MMYFRYRKRSFFHGQGTDRGRQHLRAYPYIPSIREDAKLHEQERDVAKSGKGTMCSLLS